MNKARKEEDEEDESNMTVRCCSPSKIKEKVDDLSFKKDKYLVHLSFQTLRLWDIVHRVHL